MAAITSAGIGSGLDIESLITKLVAVERQPISTLKTATDGLKTQLSAYGKVQSSLSALRDAAAKLTNPETWGAGLGTSSDSNSITVTPGSGAAAGNVSVSVSRLATAQSVSTSYQPSTGPIGQGTLTIELGTWNADQTGFDPKAGASAISIDISDGSNSLAQIRDKINAAKAGVQASIVTDQGGSRLVMRSTETGVSNGFRVAVVDGDGLLDGQGLDALSFDPRSPELSKTTQNQAAGNALAKLNGLDIESETNTLKQSIDGLTINLLKTTTSDVTLTIASDKEAIKKAINDFSTAYNSVASLLRDQTKYDQANKTAGTLQGEGSVLSVQSGLRGVSGGSTTLGGKFSRLSDLGLDPSADGTIKVNTAKLETSMADLDSLKQLFMGVDSSNAENNGLAQRMRKFADLALGIDSSLSTRQKGLQDRITGNGLQSSKLEDKATLTETRLRARYTALDVQMGKLNNLSSYVSQQMAMLNR
ncbi:flagellar filament capping protein FliD [Paucibacter sp. DJ2R-2]|uniref:flagellar filament capping protein FliD n=1 Tax=Paucibacter sp. DJ2R-2 TaxID=2893558 RepID=UPI0021E3B587|nr:flagellar filament capping protein FliD [Paucibacter sp. DJ2R-2]MCV2423295.1 flagellar filament capping protein FliD [Paucibacter sp. DJ4R-1]MCV2441486.1 flagellar filament capping protein FliD [Paucibacter sp. DJ2R-2]